jgi:hypothetical protein
MSTRIVAIERTGAPTSDLADLWNVSIRDDAATTQPVYGHVQVWGIGADGARHALFGYFSDELSFSFEELSQWLRQLAEHGCRLCPEPDMLRGVTPRETGRCALWPVPTVDHRKPRSK